MRASLEKLDHFEDQSPRVKVTTGDEMKQRFTEEQIVKILSRLKNGEKVKDLARSAGISTHTIYIWRKKFSDMTVSEAKRLKSLELENSGLKRIVADLTLDISMLKAVNEKKW